MSERLDVELHSRGLCESREKAKNLILQGNISVNGKIADKPSFKVEKTDLIEIAGDIMPYVSRGGLKLEKAVEVFGIDLKDKVAIDMGASTGGFSDVMLQNGIGKIYAVDVGSNQLANKIKNNQKVINMENTNIRNMIFEDIGEKVDFISIDTSFISLKFILPVAFSFIKDDGKIVALVKPQFEAGRENIGKKGIVKDKKIHKKVLNDIYDFIVSCGFVPEDITVSPIKGGDGNAEYLMLVSSKGLPFEPSCINEVTEL